MSENYLTVDILPYSNTHAYVRVDKNGYQWQTTWAKEFDEHGTMVSPTVEQVKEAFLENPRSFE